MLNKALSKAVPHVRRSFHASASVARVVATSPVKAQEVKVSHRTRPVHSPDVQSLGFGKYPLIEHEYDAVVV